MKLKRPRRPQHRTVVNGDSCDTSFSRLWLKDRQLVNLTSHFQGERRTVRDFNVIPYNIPRRCTATYYPETNPLVALGSVAEISNTPASKSMVISIEPVPAVA